MNPAWAPNAKRLAVWSICCDPPALDLYSPDGRRLAVTLGGGIWKVPAAGRGAVRLASGTDPAWSPDGKRIAFVSTRDGDAEIYVMRADGSGERSLTNNAVTDIQPDW